MNPSESFFRHVRPDPSGCLIWTGSINKAGYGRFCHDGIQYMAHRFIFERLGLLEHRKGRFQGSSELVVDHVCRNRACVRVSHLEIVTFAENIRRSPLHGVTKRAKTHCEKGHLFDEANTKWSRGTRLCRTCRNEWRRQHKEQHAELARQFRARQRRGQFAMQLFNQLNDRLESKGLPVAQGEPRVTRLRHGRDWIVESP